MPPKLLDAWLAKCVEDELRAVIAWRQQLTNGFKSDPESRFSDDGSNFRSEVRSPPATTTVQLIEVLTLEDVVTAYVSDGIMKVKVRFSGEAVAAFEEDSGGPLHFDVKGDVFRLVRFTVVSTPFGPADGFVQLHVDEIEYETLRRGLSDGMPVERDYSIRTLIESTTLLRIPENAALDTQDRTQPASAPVPTALNVSDSNITQTQLRTHVQTQVGREARPPSPKSYVKRPQAQIKGKVPEPTLSNDGYEVESGVNLHGPVGPINRDAEITSIGKQAVNTRLLGLLGRTRAPAPQTHLTNGGDVLQTQNLSQSQHRTVSVTNSPLTAHVSSPERAEHTTPESSQVHEPAPLRSGDRPPAHADDATRTATQLDADSLPVASLSSGKTLFAYARRVIPTAQRKLLDDPASWLPSLPGRQFPKPNVPMELLSKWNAEAAAGPPDPVLSQRSRVATPRESASLSEILADSDSDSGHSDDATQDYPPSPDKNWLPRQAAIPLSTAISSSMGSDDVLGGASMQRSASPERQHCPDLPPSSTFGSVIRGTPLDGELEVAVPHPLPVTNVAEKRKAGEHSLPPAKRPSVFPSQIVAITDTRVKPRQGGLFGQASLQSPAFSVRTSQQSSTDMAGGTSRNSPSRDSAHAALPSEHSPAAPMIQATPVQAHIADSLTQTSPSRSSTSHHTSLLRQSAPARSLPGLSPPTQQRAAPSTHHRQVEPIPQTSIPLDQFKQGKLSYQPPARPLSSQPHTYQTMQPLQGVGNKSRNRARELDCAPRDRVLQLHNGDLPGMSADELLMHRQVAQDRQTPNNKVVDVTNPGMERVSSSISSRQQSTSALVYAEASLDTPHETRPHVPQPARTSELAKPRTRPTLFGRKTWLKANYIATKSGNVRLPAVLELYQNSCPHDAGICIDDLLEAARYAFDGVHVTPDTRYIAKSNASKTEDVPRPHDSDVQRPDTNAIFSGTQQQESKANREHSIAANSSPLAPQNPGLLHRQVRMNFINDERRKSWLQKNYVPSTNGNVPLEAVLEQYRQECPEDVEVQLHTLLSVVQSVYANRNPSLLSISAQTLYSRKLETSRMITKHSKTGENVYEQARSNWIKVNYKPNRKGRLQLATVMARYKISCPDDDMVEFEDFLRAGQSAWPDHGVTPGMPWQSKAESNMPPDPKNAPAALEAGRKANHERKAKRKHDKQFVQDIVRWIRARYTWDPAGHVRQSDMWTAYKTLKAVDPLVEHKLFSRAIQLAFDMEQEQRRGIWHFAALNFEVSQSDISIHMTQDELFGACRSWLKMNYKRDSGGQCSISDLFAAYARSETTNAHLDGGSFRAVVSNVFDVKKIHLDRTAFSALAGNNDRSEASTQSSNEAVCADTPGGWFLEHYYKDREGLLHMDDLIQAFKGCNPVYGRPEGKGLVKALHRALGCVSDGDRFSRRENDCAAAEHAMDDSRHGDLLPAPAILEADSRSSKYTNELRHGDVLDFPDPSVESSSSIEWFCAAYLGIRPGNGNAFGRPLSKGKQTWSVDVLKWDL